MLVLWHLLDSARTRFRICTAGLYLRFFCRHGRRGVTLGIMHLVSRMLSILLCLNVFPFRFGMPSAKLDEREGVENRACKNAATTSSPASIPCSSGDTVTLGMPYSTDYLSRYLLAPKPIDS